MKNNSSSSLTDSAAASIAATHEADERFARLTAKLLNQLPVGIIFCDEAYICTHANQISAGILGINSNKLIGLTLAEIETLARIAPINNDTDSNVNTDAKSDAATNDYKPSFLAELLAAGGTIHHHGEGLECVITTAANAATTTRYVQLTATPLALDGASSSSSSAAAVVAGGIIVINDVTEQHAMGERLRLLQKMEATGRLAGGIAHDFNNLLAVVMMHCDLLLLNFDARATDVGRHVAEIKQASESAASLTKQLLAFGRKQMLQPRVINVNDTVERVRRMLERLIGEDIRMDFRLEPQLGDVRADPVQIEQVLLNLAINARDAMPEGGGLIIETANIELDQTYADRHIAVKPGGFVRLTVSDTGSGIDRETQAQIFEPFFTTKEKGKGTGLGLATVYGIVKQSGGSIWVYSEPNIGTTFKIYLPRLVASFDGNAHAKSNDTENRSSNALAGGAETVLLVEDEASLRRAANEILQLGGYKVLTAGSGAEALNVSRDYREPIDLLLTDIVMPGISGRELAAQLSAQRPAMRVLLMSGYTDAAATTTTMRHGVLDSETAFIEKPFTPLTLTKKIREVLDKVERGNEKAEV